MLALKFLDCQQNYYQNYYQGRFKYSVVCRSVRHSVGEGGYVVNIQGHNSNLTGDNETRPKNVCVEFLIQYK